MLTLIVNTATLKEKVLLAKDDKILNQRKWSSNFDETKRLLSEIEKTLKKSKYKIKDIEKIIVVKGPGNFSALRIGITVVNIMAFLLKIPIFSINTKQFLKARSILALQKNAKREKIAVPLYDKLPNITKAKKII